MTRITRTEAGTRRLVEDVELNQSRITQGEIMAREVAFIDRGVSDLSTLLAGMRHDVKAIVLDQDRPAVKQIVDALRDGPGVSSVHVIAHGRAGEVSFGSNALSLENLDAHSAELGEIGQALGEDGQILLWSCNAGEGERGSSFVEALARATGAQVAAATGLVGAAAKGGAWDLDVRCDIGVLKAPLTAAGMVAYREVMPVTGPTIDLNGGGAGNDNTISYTEQGAATLLDAAAVVTSGSGKIETITLTIAGFVSGDGDVLALDATGTANAAAAGVTVSYNSTTGVFTLTKAGGLSQDSTWNAIIDHIVYSYTTDDPPASRTISFTATDQNNLSSTQTDTVNITQVNDAPTATAPGSYSATEQVALSLKSGSLSVSDVDSRGGIETITLSVGEGTLSAGVGNSGVTIVSGNNSSSLVVSGTIAQLNAFLGSGAASTSTLSYTDNTDTPSASTTLTLSVNDGGNTGSGGALTGSANSTINIAAVNDAPTATAPASYSATEQVALSLKSASLSVSDVDGGAGTETITLSVVEGTLNANAGNSGATVVSGDGTSSLVVSGTIAQLNAFLGSGAASTSTLRYTDNTDTPSASTTLTLSVNDGGNTGSGGALTGSANSTINIAAVNDAPTATAPASYSATEQVALSLKSASLSVSDVDGGAGTETITLSVVEGTLNANA